MPWRRRTGIVSTSSLDREKLPDTKTGKVDVGGQ
jgi:hypothetical protein